MTYAEFAASSEEKDPKKLIEAYRGQVQLSLLENNEYDDQLMADVDGQLLQHAKDQGIEMDGFGLKDDDDDTTAVRRYALDTGDVEADNAAGRYKALKDPSIRDSYKDNPDEYEAKLEDARIGYEAAVPSEKREAARRAALNRGDLPFAVFSDKDGNKRVELGSEILGIAGDDKALAEMFKANPNLDRSLIPEIRRKLQTPNGFTASLGGIERQQDFTAGFDEMVKSDPKKFDQLESLRSAVSEGKMDNLDPRIDQINDALAGTPLYDQFDETERKAFLKDYITRQSTPRLNPNAPESGLRTLSTGEVVVPTSVMMNKEIFTKTLALLPEGQQAMAAEQRARVVGTYAKDAFKTIIARRPEFTDLYAAEKAAGKSDTEILDTWTADPKNQSTAYEYVSGIAESIPSATIGTIAGVTAMATGDKTAMSIARYYNTQDQQRKEFANLVGKDLGVGYDISTMIAPVVVDILATKGAATALRSTTGALARAAIKPVVRGFFGATVREETKGLLGSFVKGSVRRELEREGLGAVGNVTLKPTEVLNAIGRDVEAGLTRAEYSTAMFATGFNRAAGASYVQTYSTLEGLTNADGSRKFNDEQVRDMAVKHATMIGTMTGLTTLGFNALGLEGTEKIFDGGLTRKQMTGVFTRLKKDLKNMAPSVREGLDMTDPDRMIASMMTKSIQPLWKVGVEGAKGEVLEEATQQFLEDIITSRTTGEKFDIVKSIKGAMYAGLLGGVMGAGATVAADVVSSPKVDAAREAAVRRNALLSTAAKLDANPNLKATAAAVRELALNGIPEAPASGAGGIPTSTEPGIAEESLPAGVPAEGVQSAPSGTTVAEPQTPLTNETDPTNADAATDGSVALPDDDAPTQPTPEQVAAYRADRRQEIVAEWGSRHTRSGLKPGTPAEVREELETLTPTTDENTPMELPVREVLGDEGGTEANSDATIPKTGGTPSDGVPESQNPEVVSQPPSRLQVEAESLANNPKTLEKRLREALKFEGVPAAGWKLDSPNRRMVSPDGKSAIVWKTRRDPEAPESYRNQQTSIGTYTFTNDTKTPPNDNDTPTSKGKGPKNPRGSGQPGSGPRGGTDPSTPPSTPEGGITPEGDEPNARGGDADPVGVNTPATTPKVGDPITFTSSVPGTQTPTQGVIAAIDAKGRITAQVGKTKYPNARVVEQTQTATRGVSEDDKAFANAMAVKYGTPAKPEVPAQGDIEKTSRFMDMVERAADKSKDDAELSEMLDRIAPLEESIGGAAWRVAYAVSKNNAASPETKARAEAMREEWMRPGRFGQEEITNPAAVLAAARIDRTPAERIVTDALTDSDVPEAALAETPGGKEALAEVINEAAPEIITDGMPLGTMLDLGVVSENVKTLVAAESTYGQATNNDGRVAAAGSPEQDGGSRDGGQNLAVGNESGASAEAGETTTVPRGVSPAVAPTQRTDEEINASRARMGLPPKAGTKGPTAPVIPEGLYATKGTSTTFNVATADDFKIETSGKARVNGYLKNADFPGEKQNLTTGEVFLTIVPEGQRGGGLGYSLTRDAIILIRENGGVVVNMSPTSEGGRAIIAKLVREKVISGPIKTSQTGKAQYTITPASAGQRSASLSRPESSDRQVQPPQGSRGGGQADTTQQSLDAVRQQLPADKPDTRFTAANSPVTADIATHGTLADIKAWLTSVAKTGKPEHRELAKLLLKFPAVKVTPVHLNDVRWAGTYVPQTGQALINTAIPGPRGGVDTVLHELIHAATHAAIKNPTPEQALVLKRIDGIRRNVAKRAAKAGRTDLAYGLQSTDEFFTHFLTSPAFQREVAAMTPKGERNWVHVLIDAVRDLLGLKSSVLKDMIEFTQSAADLKYGRHAMTTDGRVLMLPAHHGTPHKVVGGFTTDKIGTGEGAQAFGWGLYFAGDVKVAEGYRDNLSQKANFDKLDSVAQHTLRILAGNTQQRAEQIAQDNLHSAQKAYDNFRLGEADYTAPKSHLEDLAASVKYAKEVWDLVRTPRSRWGKDRQMVLGSGNLYTVEILPEEDEMLDWDKPLSGQSDSVKQAIKAGIAKLNEAQLGEALGRAVEGNETDYDRDWNPTDGAMFYKKLALLKTPAEASKLLNELGIPGIKFLDGNSRNRPIKEIKASFLDVLPENAEFDDVKDAIDAGSFKPEQVTFLKALEADDWLGFEYPAQAISAALGPNVSNWEASQALLDSIKPLRGDASYNYVIFDGKDIQITHENGVPVTPEQATSPAPGPYGTSRMDALMQMPEDVRDEVRFAELTESLGKVRVIRSFPEGVTPTPLKAGDWVSSDTPDGRAYQEEYAGKGWEKNSVAFYINKDAFDDMQTGWAAGQTLIIKEGFESLGDTPTQADIDAFKEAEPVRYAELKAMRERVLRGAGYNRKAYHGSDEAFTQFDKSLLGKKTGAASAKKMFFATSDERVARTYAGGATDLDEYSGVVTEILLKIESPIIQSMDDVEYEGQGSLFSKLVNKAIREGDDGVIFEDVVDQFGGDDLRVISDIFAFPNPEQAKSTEPLSLDPATGQLIPPSKWGDTESPSILFQPAEDAQDSQWLKEHRDDYVHINLKGGPIDPDKDFTGWVLPVEGSAFPNAMTTKYGRPGLQAVLIPKEWVQTSKERPARIRPGFRPTFAQIGTITDAAMRGNGTVALSKVFQPESNNNAFNQEVQNYVTGNWPTNPTERYNELMSFAGQWAATYPKITVRVEDDANARSRLTYPDPSSSSPGFGGANALSFSERTGLNEAAAKRLVARDIDEEVIHYAHHEVVRARLGKRATNPEVLMEIGRMVVEALNIPDPAARRAFAQAVYESHVTYGGQDTFDPDIDPEAYLKNQIEVDAANAFTLGYEMVRQLVQFKVRGTITEESVPTLFAQAKQWFKDRIAALKKLISGSEVLGARFQKDIDATEAMFRQLKGEELLFQPASDEAFNQEVQNYVTGNWPSDAAGRYENLMAFAEEWAATYGRPPFITSVRVPRITERIGVQRSEASISPSGEISVTIGNEVASTMARTTEEFASKVRVARDIQEEFIHAANIQAIKNRVGESDDYRRDGAKETLKVFEDVVESIKSEEDRMAVSRAVMASYSMYWNLPLTEQQLSQADINLMVERMDDQEKVGLIGELVRQTIQLRRSDEITETSFHTVVKALTDWLKNYLKVLRGVASNPSSLGRMFAREVAETEAILAEMGDGPLFQPSELLTASHDAGIAALSDPTEDETTRLREHHILATTGNVSMRQRATYRTDATALERLVTYLKAAVKSLGDSLKASFNMTSAVHYDRLGRELAAAEDGYRVRSGVKAFDPNDAPLFQFAGESAEKPQFMSDSLDTAKAMAAAGKASEEIRAVTGWFPGKYDGKMRWEIPDAGATLTERGTFNKRSTEVYGGEVFSSLSMRSALDRVNTGEVLRLKDALNHPSLYEAYPAAAEVPFFPIGGNIVNGSLRTLEGQKIITATLTLKDGQFSEESRSVILHEVQHFIQGIEGFAKGGSPNGLISSADIRDAAKFTDAYKGLNKYKEQLRGLAETLATERGKKKGFMGFGGPDGRAIASLEAEIVKITEAVNSVWEYQKKHLSIDRDSTRASLLSAINAVDNKLGSSWVVSNRNAGLDMLYKSLAGEIEARDVQARANMTPEQLAATAPYSSENIAPEASIVLFQLSSDSPESEFTETNFTEVNIGNKLYESTEQDLEKKNWFVRMFAQRSDLLRAQSAVKVDREAMVNSTNYKLSVQTGIYNRAIKAESPNMDDVRSMAGSTAPFLTPEEETRLDAEYQARLEAAEADTNLGEIEAKAVRDKTLADAQREHDAAMLSADPGERAEAVTIYEQVIKDAEAEFRRASQAAKEAAEIEDPGVTAAKNIAETKRENARKQRDLSQEQAKQDYDDEVQSPDAATRVAARGKYEAALKEIKKGHDRTIAEITKERDEAISLRSPEARVIQAKDAANEWLRVAKEQSMLNQADKLRVEQDAAAERLARNSPLTHAAVQSLRKTLDEFQAKYAKENKETKPSLSLMIDRSNGLYLVRAYEFYRDPQRREKIMSDPLYADLKERLVDLFGKEFARDALAVLKADPVNANRPDADLEAQARNNVRDLSLAKFEDYLLNRDGPARMGQFADGVRLEVERFLKKNNQDPLIAEMLGEIDDPLFNLTNTIESVSNLLFTHRQNVSLAKDGQASGYFVTEAQMKANPNKYRGWVPLVSKNPDAPAFSPLGGLYATAEHKEAFDAAFGTGSKEAINTANEALATGKKLIMGAAGKSMATMILGNPASYVRNIFGNLFPAASQGINPFSKKGLKSAQATWDMVRGQGKGDQAFIEKMIALRVLGDGANIEFMREFFTRYQENPTGAAAWVAERGEKLSPAAMEQLRKGKGAWDKLTDVLGRSSEFTETFLGPLVFLNELEVHLKAGLPQSEAEQEAARITKKVLPGKSERSQAVTEFGKSGVATLMAPFLGFKSEMIRSVVGTWQVALEHTTSDNPVLKAHGRRRLAASFAIQGGIVTLLPILLRSLARVDDEEDQLFRAALPSYEKNTNFWYFRNADGSISTANMTFAIPYSITHDWTTQTFLALRAGRFSDVPAIFGRLFGGELIGEQIVAGQVLDVMRNKDDTSGHPIYREDESMVAKMYKQAEHVIGGAYIPAIVKKADQLIESRNRPDKEDEPFWYSPLGITLATVAPFKPKGYETEKFVTRALREVTTDNRQLWTITAKLTSPQAMAPGEATKLIKERVDAHLKNSTRGYRYIQAAKGFNMTPRQIIMAAKEADWSQERTQLALQGFANNKPLPAETLRKIKEIDPKRYVEVVNAMRQLPSRFDLRDR